MLFLYIVIHLIVSIHSIKLFKRLINPVIIYATVWILTVILYELKLINYVGLTVKSYLVIISFYILFSFGCFFGYRIKQKRISSQVNSFIHEKKLMQMIILTSLISSVAIIPNAIALMKNYGVLGLLHSTAEIYNAREFGSGLNNIGYFSPFIFISLIFMSIYTKKYGFKKIFLITIGLSVLNMLSFGGRNNVIISCLCIMIPFVINNKLQIKLSKKTKLSVIVILLLLVMIFYNINNIRANITTVSNHVSPIATKFFSNNHGLYKIYAYITGPLGYLNSFLEDPFYSFGANSFLPIYKQLPKVGIEVPLMWTLPFNNVPISTNVGTYITELIIDFTLPGSFIVIFFLGIITGYFYRKIKNSNEIVAHIVITVQLIILILSFFMWYFRSINIWILLIFGIIFSYYIDGKKNIVLHKSNCKDIKLEV